MKKAIISIFLFVTAHVLSAQEIVLASGGDASGLNGSSSYSVGQVFYSSTSVSAGTISQGAQQSVELFTLINDNVTSVNLNIVSYPNPAKDYLMLRVVDFNLDNLWYVLYDLKGACIAQNALHRVITEIDLQTLSPGSYVLQVFESTKQLKSFKIIKN